MIRDTIGRGDFKLPANLMNRRRKALLSNGLEQKVIDRFLPVGERWKHDSGILNIYSVVNRAVNKASSASLRSPDSLQRTQTYASARRPSRALQLKPS